MCEECKTGVKTWNGDDPSCAFKNLGLFEKDNWNCGIIRKLRSYAIENGNVFENNDCSVAILTHYDFEGFIMLSWYKRRGNTSLAWWIFDDEYNWLTLEKAEEFFLRLNL